jgi:ornithine cyclodeaminase/alanine dehydrogenase-like protein (mu-crystallin family)
VNQERKPMGILYLDEAQVRRLLAPEDAVRLVEAEFAEPAAEPPILPSPRILRTDLRARFGQTLLVKSCTLPARGVAGVRVFGSGDRFIVLLEAKTLRTLAWVDDHWLYQLRTAAEGAVAAKRLARPGPVTLGLVGAGVLARPLLQLLAAVTPLREVRITSRTSASRASLAETMKRELKIPVRAVDSIEEAVQGASVIATLTTANAPLLQADWVEAGTLILSMGNGQELAPDIFRRLSKVIVDDWETCRAMGDIAAALRAGTMAETDLHGEMSEVFRGQKAGRENAEEVILVVPQGMISQDVLLADHVYRRALAQNAGTAWPMTSGSEPGL